MRALRSAVVVGLGTLTSRILGLVRDIMTAAAFGTGLAIDAFVLAFTIPNLLRRLLGEGALSAAFIPIFAEEMETGGRERAVRFFNVTLTALVLVLLVLLGLGLLFTLVVPPAWFGEGAAKADLTFQLLRIMLPYMLLICVMGMLMGVLNSMQHFFTPAIAPALLNVCWIAGLVIATPLVDGSKESLARALAVAVLIGGVLQMAVQLPAMRAKGVPIRPCLDLRNPAFRRMLVLMLPVVLGLAPVQINIVFDRLIAEFCVEGDGANGRLFFGIRLMQFPLALIGIAMGVAVFPGLSRLAAEGRREEMGRELGRALRVTLFLGLPATTGLAVLAGPIIALIYRHGAFDAAAAAATTSVLFCYSLGVFATCGLQVVTRAFYALKDMKTPVRVTLATVGLNLVLNLILVWPLADAGLALATSITAVVNLVALAWYARTRLGILALKPVVRSAAGSLVAAVVCGLAAWGALEAIRASWPGEGVAERLARVLVPVVAGGTAFLVASAVLRLRELRILVEALRNRRS
jgi:putative peptidoglycan lipid II flippase